MFAEDNKPFAPGDRMLRQFAGLWVVFFGAVSALQYFRHARPTVGFVLAILAVTIGPAGLLWPRTIKPIFVGWMTLARPIGWVVSRVILAILYLGVFTPFAVVFRVAGRDALHLKPGRDNATYWRVKPQAAADADYLKQF